MSKTAEILDMCKSLDTYAASGNPDVLKSHVGSYTRKDGTFVNEHDRKIEAHGVKGMKSTPWRKTFKSQKHFEEWLDKNDGGVEVHGTREIEPHNDGKLAAAGSPYAAARKSVLMAVSKDRHPTAKQMLDEMEAGSDEAEAFNKRHFGASHEIVRGILKDHGIDVGEKGGGSQSEHPSTNSVAIRHGSRGHRTP